MQEIQDALKKIGVARLTGNFNTLYNTLESMQKQDEFKYDCLILWLRKVMRNNGRPISVAEICDRVKKV